MVRKGSRTGPLGSGLRVGGDRVGYHESGNTPGFLADAREARLFGKFPYIIRCFLEQEDFES